MLTLTNVHKEYEDFTLDCSIELMPGRITGLIGRNGAGKSTVFKVALGLVGTDGGEVTVFGKPVEMLTMQDRQRIGVAFADAGFSEYLTITDIAPVLAAMYPSVTEKEFLEQCSRMELPLSKKIKEFSTGMRAKLKVLIALDHEAELLILDEPTAGHDYRHYTEIMEFLKRVNEEFGTTIIMITHDMHLMLEYTDRAIVIADGHLIADDTPAKVLTNEEIADKAYLKKTSLYDLAVNCQIEDPSEFVERFIAYERENRMLKENPADV